MDKARETPFSIADRRYKLHDTSFGTLLLQIAGLLGRPNPSTNPTPTNNAAVGGNDAPKGAQPEDSKTIKGGESQGKSDP